MVKIKRRIWSKMLIHFAYRRALIVNYGVYKELLTNIKW